MKSLNFIFFASFCLLAVMAHEQNENHDHHTHPKYSFEYGVQDFKTGDFKDQWEHRDGDVVKGGYFFKEADGTIRVVEYHADDHNGFHAKVKNIGKAHNELVSHHSHSAENHDDHQMEYPKAMLNADHHSHYSGHSSYQANNHNGDYKFVNHIDHTHGHHNGDHSNYANHGHATSYVSIHKH
ncbi:uncharacterized protein LOC142235347 [Haematobia irritans]|uniref:uncharacterized protein LOC142235347 n=1 Tax=Haematobia irritans TaxID=7368 RepID=UPI003F50817F